MIPVLNKQHKVCPGHCGWLPGVRVLLVILLICLMTRSHAASGDFLSTEDARHLASRSGIGAAPDDVLRLIGKSRVEAVDSVINGIKPMPAVAMPAWTLQPVPHYHMRYELGDSFRVQFNNQRHREISELRQWWVLNMLETESPQTERLVLFWHDVFATSYHDTDKQSLAMARQNDTFRQHGFGSWETLLKLMIRDAALLEFLNADSNHKRSPNENLARELLELFTLGEGEYEEATVREAARSLTGYTSNRFHNLDFQLNTWKQDRDEKTLFGQRGAFTGDELIDLILQQPAAARFLATRFWKAFVSDGEPEADWLESQANEFRSSGYHIPTLYRNVLLSDAFWDSRYRGAMIKSPVDLIVGTARTLQYPKNQWKNMPKWLTVLGMSLFAPPNVAGWDEGAAFVTTGRLLDRYKLLRTMLAKAHRSMINQSKSSDTGSSEDSSLAIRSNNPTTESMMMQVDPIESASEATNVHIQMAAEDYRGAAKYQLRVLGEKGIIWQTGPREFSGGHDTQELGRLRDATALNWQRESFSIPSRIVDQASRVRVAFLNDAAGSDGDRNLYVDEIDWNGQRLFASMGIQTSGCPPESSSNSGNLYCAGFLELLIPRQSPMSATSQGASSMVSDNSRLWTASSAFLKWARNNEKRGTTNVGVVLNDFVTPQQQFHTLVFSLYSEHGQPLRLQLGSYDCWPDCFTPMPECAWQDEHFVPNKTLAFPWAESDHQHWGRNHAFGCHFSSLTDQSKALVASLWNSAPDILLQLRETRKGQRLAAELDAMLALLASRDEPIAKTPYANRATDIVLRSSINTAIADASMQSFADGMPTPSLVHGSLEDYLVWLAEQNLGLPDLMMPAVQIEGIEPLPTMQGRKYGRYLKALASHPLFQVK